MTDLERAAALAALFTHCGDRWREVIPLDLTVSPKQASVQVGVETIVRCDDGKWRRVVAS
jgi:hypothetical protein